MVFSDTTNKNGIIQDVEFWTGLGDGAVSGNSTLLKQITSRVNQGFDRLMPLLLSYTSKPRWDDTNHDDLPVTTFDIVSGQADYSILEDDNNLDILNITDVRILQSATATDYVTLEQISADDERAITAMTPNSGDTGVPTGWFKSGNIVYFDKKPNYSATNGVKILFEREQSYFSSSDTTKEPGIPKPFHGLLPLYAAYDWVAVNKPEYAVLLSRIEAQIVRREQSLRDMISMRNPVSVRLTANVERID